MPDGDVVATWNVPLHDKVHRIEFEHGTTTGKRVIRVDHKVSLLLKLMTSSESKMMCLDSFSDH